MTSSARGSRRSRCSPKKTRVTAFTRIDDATIPAEVRRNFLRVIVMGRPHSERDPPQLCPRPHEESIAIHRLFCGQGRPVPVMRKGSRCGRAGKVGLRIHLTGGAVMLCEENHLCGPVHFSKQRRETNKMEAVLQPQPRRANLLLHCGAHAVDRAVASTSRTTGLRYIYESQEGRIMLILWKVTQGKPPG